MRKENILVAVLVVIVLGGIYGYTSMNGKTNPSADRTVALAHAATVDTAASGSPSAPVSEEIVWKDYTPGMALARQENKGIFLYFHASWCTYCVKLKKTTFKDERVVSYLNENFINIRVDTDQSQALANEWQVKGLPTMWFLESDGKKINRMPGYVEAGQLLKILEYIQTKSYTTMAFQEFMKK